MTYRPLSFYKNTVKKSAIIVLLAIGCKLSDGYLGWLVVMMGVFWAMKGECGKAICCYLVLPFLVIFNPFLLGITVPLISSARGGLLLIGIALTFSAIKRSGTFKLPLGSLFLYLCIVLISSIDGYCPTVSYLKLVNFSFFLIGLILGTKNLDKNPVDAYLLRTFIMGMSCVLIFGSLLLLPFPAYAYSTSSAYLVQQYGIEYAEEMIKNMGSNAALFSGLANHSQSLAPLTAMVISFALSDMLLVEKRITKFHVILIGCAFICAYLTHSRTGLFSISIGFISIGVMIRGRMPISPIMRRRIKGIFAGFFLFACLAAIVSEVHSNTVTNWLRKGDRVESGHSLGEAIVSTRMGAVDEMMSDFKKSPLIGMGFQVNADSARFNGKGFVLFAPVEKGLLPLVVIGEGGSLGAITFLIFIFSFYTGCAKMKAYVTMVMFTTFLATNIGEATFFSPGGTGGILWVFASVGGLVLDAYIKAGAKEFAPPQYTRQIMYYN